MGANAANKAFHVAGNLLNVLAIELLAACQAADFRGPELLSPVGHKIYTLVRTKVSFIDRDRSVHEDIKTLSELIADGKMTDILKEGV